MEGSQTLMELLKSHVFASQDKDICDQCIRPWNDGICTCGHGNDANIQRIINIAEEFIRNGHDIRSI